MSPSTRTFPFESSPSSFVGFPFPLPPLLVVLDDEEPFFGGMTVSGRAAYRGARICSANTCCFGLYTGPAA